MSLFTLVLCVNYYAVRQWRTRLHACVKAKGDHFEHMLPWLNDEMPDKLFNRSILTIGFYYVPNFWSNALLAILRTTYVTELNSSRTVLVRNVTQRCEIYAECDAAYLDMPLYEIS